jgi:LuxR family maltose regulon positive regulatory protein
LQAFRVRLWLAQKNDKAAIDWAKKYENPDTGSDFSYLRESEHLALVRVRMLQNEFGDALGIIHKLLAAAKDAGRIGSLVEMFVLQAVLYQSMNDIPKALDALQQALEIARPEDYLRVFLDEGKPVIELLRHAGSKGIESQYVATILAEVRQESDGSVHENQPLIDPLSEREIEILRLLADGFSNQEIAERLIIAVGTVKAHTVNIYRKLNVNSRMQAVARARELNIL